MSTAKALFATVYSEKALSYLESLTLKLKQQIRNKVDALGGDPLPPGHKLLKGSIGEGERLYRIRSGDYRVLYLVKNPPPCVVVLDIGHRKDVYR